ncbi:hypothetical protein K474DRAFT_1605738 [Panus rudis PR-1116 ss-1]|nr:hypothetical protein K474DRAFT_1605738 [Panus rudis PR-1116 ss-1]
MDTPSVLSVQQQMSLDPLPWPKCLTIPDLRMLLRKGNSRPSPGPDLWEKCNLLLNLPFAWLNHLLVPYLRHHCILPQGQVATQPGVQARDLTSFIAQLHTWSNRHNVPIYLLRRDQQKGFDRLEPEGFYDAVTAYGLPHELILLDQSAQADVPYRVKTSCGLTDVFTLSGITKQGGPFSPLKSTLTTSMGNHWLQDVSLNHDDCVSIHTSQAHVPDDRLVIHPCMVEAMDDSLIIAHSLPTVQRSCGMMEQFQLAYGWTTNWSKSLLSVLNCHDTDVPNSIPMPTVDLTRPGDSTLIRKNVAVLRDQCDFLRVRVNDTNAQYRKIRDLILNFSLPHLHTRLPLTALWRIFSQCLASRIRPYLSFQPVSRQHAVLLDNLLAQRVHEYFSFPFRFNSSLLMLPLNSLGFDFPSFSRMNDAAAVSGLLRDLNHHVPIFRDMARITLTDWMCSVSHQEKPHFPNLANCR